MVAEMAQVFLTASQELLPPAAGEESANYFAALVARARAGDEVAFERIMLATERRVVSIAWRMLGNQDDARDVTQEVYLRVFKYLGRFRAGEDFRAWLYRITINACHDFTRRKHSSGLAQADDLEGLQSTAMVMSHRGPDLEHVALQGQQIALIRLALESLPAKERAALVLRDLEGLSTEEVATVLGSRPVTVRSQVSSARAKIKKYCDKVTRMKGAIRGNPDENPDENIEL
jgi:RNA polymerase sigma-70 factor, ECF subfamily